MKYNLKCGADLGSFQHEEEGNTQEDVKLKAILEYAGIFVPAPGGLLLAADLTVSPPGGMNHC